MIALRITSTDRFDRETSTVEMVDPDSPIGNMFAANPMTVKVSVTDKHGHETSYERTDR